jgi:hypothetical protein
MYTGRKMKKIKNKEKFTNGISKGFLFGIYKELSEADKVKTKNSIKTQASDQTRHFLLYKKQINI